MKVINRIYEYLEFKQVKPSAFERNMGMSNGYLGKQLQRQADVGESVIVKILENCPDISPVWLLLGYGEMLKNEGNKQKDYSYYEKKILELQAKLIAAQDTIIQLMKKNG
ncbi:MAG TPA: hypothetical protein PLZ52_12200 [Bacteroidales bacterium]|nr:hypothetical protein [Bacteroidales bacterium]